MLNTIVMTILIFDLNLIYVSAEFLSIYLNPLEITLSYD